jgi:hypothetical protein
MALGKLEPKAVGDDLEEKKPKRGASCGEANTQTAGNATSRGAKPRSRGFSGVEPGQSVGRESGLQARIGERPGGQRQGGNGSRGEITAARGEKPLNGDNPGRGCGMKEAREAGGRRKPSRGCENLRTERSGGLATFAKVDALRVMPR